MPCPIEAVNMCYVVIVVGVHLPVSEKKVLNP